MKYTFLKNFIPGFVFGACFIAGTNYLNNSITDNVVQEQSKLLFEQDLTYSKKIDSLQELKKQDSLFYLQNLDVLESNFFDQKYDISSLLHVCEELFITNHELTKNINLTNNFQNDSLKRDELLLSTYLILKEKHSDVFTEKFNSSFEETLAWLESNY